MSDQTERMQRARRSSKNRFPICVHRKPWLRAVPYVADDYRVARGLAVAFAIICAVLAAVWLVTE